METPTPNQQENMDLVARAGALIATGFAEPDDDLFAEDFVWHYYNAFLPELHGDHGGADGLGRFFERLYDMTDAGFHIEPTSLAPHGDELVIACVTNTITLAEGVFEFEAVVVWRAFDGRIHEGWDIPAVNTMRAVESG